MMDADTKRPSRRAKAEAFFSGEYFRVHVGHGYSALPHVLRKSFREALRRARVYHEWRIVRSDGVVIAQSYVQLPMMRRNPDAT